MKSDGSYTYFAGDVAYHYDKLQRGFDHYRNVFGADHIGYISRIKAAVAALSDGKADFADRSSASCQGSARAASPCACRSGPARS